MSTKLFVPPADWTTRLQVEGDPFSLIGSNTSGTSVATGSVNTLVITTGIPAKIGKNVYLDTATVSLDNAALAQFNLASDGSQRFTGSYVQLFVPANSVVTFPVKQMFRPFQFSGGPTLNIRNNLTGGSVTYKGAVGINARAITDDFNFEAQHTIMVAGDSTTNGTGPTETSKMYPFVFRDWLISQGNDVRVILKSASGTTSTEHESYRAAGWHGSCMSRYSMGIYNLGINDAIGSVASSVVVDNVTAFWNWWSAKYQYAPLIILGPTPLENNTSESNAATYRTAVSSWVTSVGSPYLKFADPTDLWDRTSSSNYAASDTPGDRVHYVDSAHSLVSGLLQTTFTSNNLVLNSRI